MQSMDMNFGPLPNVTAPTPLPFNTNSSASGIVSYGCTTPSSNTINGMPAFACGPDFDETLDNYLGYLSGSDTDANSTLAALVPGYNSVTVRLARRGFFSKLKAAVKSVAKVVESKLSPLP